MAPEASEMEVVDGALTSFEGVNKYGEPIVNHLALVLVYWY